MLNSLGLCVTDEKEYSIWTEKLNIGKSLRRNENCPKDSTVKF
jgi:hypothetical protein